MRVYNGGMEIIKSKCDKCFEDRLVDGLFENQKPKPYGKLIFPDEKFVGDTTGRSVYVQNPEFTEWLNKRAAISDSLPEVWCVQGDDDYMTTICLDCLGLQLKVNK